MSWALAIPSSFKVVGRQRAAASGEVRGHCSRSCRWWSHPKAPFICSQLPLPPFSKAPWPRDPQDFFPRETGSTRGTHSGSLENSYFELLEPSSSWWMTATLPKHPLTGQTLGVAARSRWWAHTCRPKEWTEQNTVSGRGRVLIGKCSVLRGSGSQSRPCGPGQVLSPLSLNFLLCEENPWAKPDHP